MPEAVIQWYDYLLDSPTVQITFWGILTFITVLYATFKWLFNHYDLNENYRAVLAGIMGMVWTLNVTAWMSSTIVYTLISDSFFLLLAIFVYFKLRREWIKVLAVLYIPTVGLDFAFWRGMYQEDYAFLSNVFYWFELIAVGGFITKLDDRCFSSRNSEVQIVHG